MHLFTLTATLLLLLSTTPNIPAVPAFTSHTGSIFPKGAVDDKKVSVMYEEAKKFYKFLLDPKHQALEGCYVSEESTRHLICNPPNTSAIFMEIQDVLGRMKINSQKHNDPTPVVGKSAFEDKSGPDGGDYEECKLLKNANWWYIGKGYGCLDRRAEGPAYDKWLLQKCVWYKVRGRDEHRGDRNPQYA